jgi:hypothetical protein
MSEKSEYRQARWNVPLIFEKTSTDTTHAFRR